MKRSDVMKEISEKIMEYWPSYKPEFKEDVQHMATVAVQVCEKYMWPHYVHKFFGVMNDDGTGGKGKYTIKNEWTPEDE